MPYSLSPEMVTTYLVHEVDRTLAIMAEARRGYLNDDAEESSYDYVARMARWVGKVEASLFCTARAIDNYDPDAAVISREIRSLLGSVKDSAPNGIVLLGLTNPKLDGALSGYRRLVAGRVVT